MLTQKTEMTTVNGNHNGLSHRCK